MFQKILAENSTIQEYNQLLQKRLLSLENTSKNKTVIIAKKTPSIVTRCYYKRKRIACGNTKRYAYLAMCCAHKSTRKPSITRKNPQQHTNMLTKNATTYTFYIKNDSKQYVPVCKLEAVSNATESSKSVELPPTSKSH